MGPSKKNEKITGSWSSQIKKEGRMKIEPCKKNKTPGTTRENDWIIVLKVLEQYASVAKEEDKVKNITLTNKLLKLPS